MSAAENNFRTPKVQAVINQVESGEKQRVRTAPSCFWKHLKGRKKDWYLRSLRRAARRAVLRCDLELAKS